MTAYDHDYYRARLDAEREAIESATCEQARQAHQALANHYEKLLCGSGDEPRTKLLLILRAETSRQA
jgi:hypothetical protein